MGKLPELLFIWAPLAIVVVVWIMLRPKYGNLITESLERSRECIELQKRIFSCLEDIRAELKGANTVKGN
jgi:hypothetical protein